MLRSARVIRYRPALLNDEPMLWEMLYHAIHVPPGAAPPALDVVRGPELARYVDGWSAEDLGQVADSAGAGGPEKPVGAAWLRLLARDRAGYGHVGDDVPELAVAMLPEWRGLGIGTAMLQRLLATARLRHARVSLSVSAANPARRLYERLGFQPVGMRGDAIVMVLDLNGARLIDADLTWRDLRDKQVENQLASELREIRDEDVAFAHVRKLVRIDSKVGLSLARRVLKRRTHFEALLRDGLPIGNASTIRDWIDSSARSMGGARVVEIVRERLEDDPLSVSNALYWLWPHARDDDAMRASLNRMQREVNARFPERAQPLEPE